MKLTPWFHSHVKPVHIGEYEIINAGILAWWNGSAWSEWYFPNDKASKEFHRRHTGAIQKLNWRGLAEKPK